MYKVPEKYIKLQPTSDYIYSLTEVTARILVDTALILPSVTISHPARGGAMGGNGANCIPVLVCKGACYFLYKYKLSTSTIGSFFTTVLWFLKNRVTKICKALYAVEL